MKTTTDDWLTVSELSSETGLTRCDIYTAVKQGLIPYHKQENGRLLFRRQELNNSFSNKARYYEQLQTIHRQ